MTTRRLAPAVALLLAATGVALGASATPAAAAPCSGSSGVTVVVDFNELGGISSGCDGDGGGVSAARSFVDAGFPLSRASRDPSFVCKVSGLPADAPCVNASPPDAYWSLWWSDGESGSWTYASLGVDGLKIPAGGYVAFSWHQGSGKATAPDVAPTPRKATPTPSPTKTTQPAAPTTKSTSGSGGSGGAAAGGSSGPGSNAPSSAPTVSATSSTSASVVADAAATEGPGKPKKKRTKPGAEGEPTETASALPQIEDVTSGPPSTATVADDGGGVPTWLLVGLALGVLGAAAAVPLARRRR